MPTLSTLSEDLLLEIVNRLVENYDGFKSQIAGLRSLSLTCSFLNFFCGHVIFRTYRLDIRRFRWQATGAFPKGSITESWDGGAINFRLAHLRSKAPFVREIHITDQGELASGAFQVAPSGAMAFPSGFIPELLSTLRMLKGLTSIHLITHSDSQRPNAIIDTDLWNWLLGVGPTGFSLNGHFELPNGKVLQPIENLTMLRLHSCTNANKTLLDVRFIYFLTVRIFI